MLASIRHNLARLMIFKGRDARNRFWPYVGAVFIGYMVVTFIVMATQFAPFMVRMQAFAVTHPDQATVTAGHGHYSVSIEGTHPEINQAFMDLISTIMLVSATSMIVLVILFAAAVARRLHDTGASGLWGLLPLPFAAFAMTAMPRLFAQFDAPGGPDLGLFFLIFFNNMTYTAMVALLVFLLARRTDPGINRFGPPAAV